VTDLVTDFALSDCRLINLLRYLCYKRTVAKPLRIRYADELVTRFTDHSQTVLDPVVLASYFQLPNSPNIAIMATILAIGDISISNISSM
jgi:hypothetical protein